MPERQPKLNRTLTLPMLVLYGLGTIVGAGIYALIGEIAGVAGYGAPLSFLIASIIAGFTACSFAELSARYPRAAGAALYVRKGFNVKQLSLLVGLLVVLSGVVSSAALANGFTGYLQQFLVVDRALAIVGVSVLLGAPGGNVCGHDSAFGAGAHWPSWRSGDYDLGDHVDHIHRSELVTVAH